MKIVCFEDNGTMEEKLLENISLSRNGTETEFSSEELTNDLT